MTEENQTQEADTNTPHADANESISVPSTQTTDEGGESQVADSQPSSEEGGGNTTEDSGSVVPEKYDLSLPENADLTGDYLEQVESYAKELGLSQEQAAQMVERDASLVAGYRDRVLAEHQQEVQGWTDQVKADADLGGINFESTVKHAQSAIERFGDDSFRKVLNESGYGNHPDFVRFVSKIGKAIAEDSTATKAGNMGNPTVRVADKMFPSHTPKNKELLPWPLRTLPNLRYLM